MARTKMGKIEVSKTQLSISVITFFCVCPEHFNYARFRHIAIDIRHGKWFMKIVKNVLLIISYNAFN